MTAAAEAVDAEVEALRCRLDYAVLEVLHRPRTATPWKIAYRPQVKAGAGGYASRWGLLIYPNHLPLDDALEILKSEMIAGRIHEVNRLLEEIRQIGQFRADQVVSEPSDSWGCHLFVPQSE